MTWKNLLDIIPYYRADTEVFETNISMYFVGTGKLNCHQVIYVLLALKKVQQLYTGSEQFSPVNAMMKL